jgi:hypothetical protein
MHNTYRAHAKRDNHPARGDPTSTCLIGPSPILYYSPQFWCTFSAGKLQGLVQGYLAEVPKQRGCLDSTVGIEPRLACRTKSRKCKNGFSHLDYSQVDQLYGTEVPPRNVRLVFEDGVWGIFSVWPSRVAQQGCLFMCGSCRMSESTSGDISHDSCDPRDVEEGSGLSSADPAHAKLLFVLPSPVVLSGLAEVPFENTCSSPVVNLHPEASTT